MTASVRPMPSYATPTGNQIDPHSGSTAAQDILRIAETIKAAAGLTEGRFLDMGSRLGSSVEVLDRLTKLFGRLQIELDSPAIKDATEGLANVAAQMSVLGGAQRVESKVLTKLSDIASGLGYRIDEIYNEVRTIEMLNLYARITASSIGPAGNGFLTCISEIGESLKLAEVNIRHFRNDLTLFSSNLDSTSASEVQFNERQAETVAIIPQQLSQSVELINTRRQAAAQAAGSVSERSHQVGSGIASVVMALQIGDATRQRMEHVQEAAQLLANILAGVDGPVDVADHPWAGLSRHERHHLAAAGCLLQTAQLNDTADEFGREVKTIYAALTDLAADAPEIVRLSKEAFGSADGGAFFNELDDDVRQSHSLLATFHADRLGADRTMAALIEIVTRLASHIGTVRTVEGDIRMTGVNATVMSSRLGIIGSALSVIANEVMNSSARTAAVARSTTGDVENIVTTAKSLGGQQQLDRLAEITAVTDLMTKSTDQIRSVGSSLASAFEELLRDGLTVAALLDDTAASLAVTEEIDATLRFAAKSFADIAATAPASELAPADASDRMFQTIAKVYTMVREREIHCAIVPGSAITAPPLVSAEANIDDMLF